MPHRQLTLPHMPAFLTSAEVAQLLGVHPVTVRRWRVRNKEAGYIKEGPPYLIRGRSVAYPTDAFKAWCGESHTVDGVVHANAPASTDPALTPQPEAESQTPAPSTGSLLPADLELELQQVLGG